MLIVRRFLYILTLVVVVRLFMGAIVVNSEFVEASNAFRQALLDEVETTNELSESFVNTMNPCLIAINEGRYDLRCREAIDIYKQIDEASTKRQKAYKSLRPYLEGKKK